MLTALDRAEYSAGGPGNRPAISLVVPRNAFVDPQGEALTYAATQSRGQALPSGVTFDAAAETFTGTPPSPTESLGITVNATDSIGLSSSKNFTAHIQLAPRRCNGHRRYRANAEPEPGGEPYAAVEHLY